MKILQVTGYESPGSRFHGLAVTPLLKEYGIESRHLVWEKDTDNSEVLTFQKNRAGHKFITNLEITLSLQSILYRNALQMISMPQFQEADIIHLHLIHVGFFSIGHLHEITRLKPTIWTFHDPWAMTGRCVYPMDCTGWKKNCGVCPDLNTPFPMKIDNSRFMFDYKNEVYKKSNFDIIVASKWMENMVNLSPLFDKKVKVHHLPFGLNLDFFLLILLKKQENVLILVKIK